MGGKSGGSAPAPPDPAATAAAQSGLNSETARLTALLNRMNQVTPYGSLTYSRPNATTGALATGQPLGSGATTTQGMGSGAPTQGAGMGGAAATTAAGDPGAYNPDDVWQSTITLSPEGQRRFDQQNQLSESVNNLALRNFGNVEAAQANPFSLNQFGDRPQFSMNGLPDAPIADDATRQRVEQAIFDRARARLDPMRDQQQEALRTRLTAQGIPINSEAYGREFETFNRGQNDLYNSALAQAIAGGGQEQSRLFGLGSAARSNAVNERQLQYSNDTSGRSNAIQEALLARNQPINELAALLGTSPGVQTPQFTPAGATGVAPTDITGPTMAAYQGQLNDYNAQQQRGAANMGGLYGLGGQLGAASILGKGGPAAGGAAAAGGPASLGALYAASLVGSSRDIKTNKAEMEPVLDRVKNLAVERWNYIGEDQPHIGPYAEDFKQAFKTGGDGKVIFLQDAIGVCLKAIQELTAKVEMLEAARG